MPCMGSSSLAPIMSSDQSTSWLQKPTAAQSGHAAGRTHQQRPSASIESICREDAWRHHVALGVCLQGCIAACIVPCMPAAPIQQLSWLAYHVTKACLSMHAKLKAYPTGSVDVCLELCMSLSFCRWCLAGGWRQVYIIQTRLMWTDRLHIECCMPVQVWLRFVAGCTVSSASYGYHWYTHYDMCRAVSDQPNMPSKGL